MMTTAAPITNASHDGGSSSPEDAIHNLRFFLSEEAYAKEDKEKRSPIVRLKRGVSRSDCVAALAEFCLRYPAQEAEAFEFVAGLLYVSPVDLRKSVETQAAISEKKQRFADAHSSLIEKFEADYEIEELLPPSVAAKLRKSCNRTGTDFISALFFLLTTVGTLIGAKIMCHSGVDSTLPIPGNLYFFSCGDSSSYKSRTSKKFIEALKKLAEIVARLWEENKKATNEITDEGEKRAALKELSANRQDYLFEAPSFSDEAYLKDLGAQAPRCALHVHQDEGADLFGGERYAKSSGKISLIKKFWTENWGEPATGKVARTNSDNISRFRYNLTTITANVQRRFVGDIIDLAEDSQGWSARTIVVESRPTAVIRDDNEERGGGIEDDPIYEFLIQRLFPWCRDITTRAIKGVDKFGFTRDYEVLRLDKYDGAQALYDEHVELSKALTRQLEEEGREAALRSFIHKMPERVMKFALLLHILETQEGMRFSTTDRTDIGLRAPIGDPLHELKKTPISKVTMERALRIEAIARAQYQHITDICRSAPAIREEEVKRESELATLQFVLDKVRILGSIKEGDFKKKFKGSRGLSREDITGALEVLANAGCILRNKPQGQRSNHITYIKELR